MFGIFKERKKQREDALRASKIKATSNLALATAKMTATPCAVNNFQNCSRSCVHFREGQVVLNFRGDGYVSFQPECRLWR